MRTLSSTLLTAAAAVLLVLVAVASTGVSAQAPKSGNRRILNCPLGATKIDQCDPATYAIKVGATVAPGIVIAILILLAFPIFVSLRCCCNWCGGRRQSPNLCCAPSDKTLPARYSKADIQRAKIFMILMAALAVTSLIWGSTVSGQVITALNELGDAIVNVPSHLNVRVQSIVKAVTVPIYNSTTQTVTEVDLYSQGGIKSKSDALINDMKSMVSSSIGMYRSKINEFAFVLFIIFTVPVGIIAAGAFLVMFNIRSCAPMTLALISFFMGMIVWMVHGVFAGVSFVMDDLCTEVSGVANNRRNIISPLMGCSNGKSSFTAFLDEFKKLRTARALLTCSALSPMCYKDVDPPATNEGSGRVYACKGGAPPVDCSKITFENMTDIMDKLRVHTSIENGGTAITAGKTCGTAPWATQCYIENCAEDCKVSGVLSPIGRASKSVVSLHAATVKVSKTINTLASQFAHCDAILSYVMGPFDAPCGDMVYAFGSARDAAGVAGLSIVGGIFALVFGSKRFIDADEYGDKALKDEN